MIEGVLNHWQVAGKAVLSHFCAMFSPPLRVKTAFSAKLDYYHGLLAARGNSHETEPTDD